MLATSRASTLASVNNLPPEPVWKVPLFIRWPNCPSPREINKLIMRDQETVSNNDHFVIIKETAPLEDGGPKDRAKPKLLRMGVLFGRNGGMHPSPPDPHGNAALQNNAGYSCN